MTSIHFRSNTINMSKQKFIDLVCKHISQDHMAWVASNLIERHPEVFGEFCEDEMGRILLEKLNHKF
nr:hypothetical protein 15 [bacterium]